MGKKRSLKNRSKRISKKNKSRIKNRIKRFKKKSTKRRLKGG